MILKGTITLLFTSLYLSVAAQQNNEPKQLPNSDYFSVRGGLPHFYKAVASKKEVTVAFVGGSITFNPGWRDKVCDYLLKKFPAARFRFIAAGIPSLGSLPHAFRLRRDVLDSGKIDLLLLEAAVNDRVNQTDSLTQVRSLEGIVRNMLKSNPMADIIMLAFADPYKTDDYHQHIVPVEIINHKLVADHYNLPFINLAKEIHDRLQHKEFSWEKDFINLHPSPFGQQLYFNTIKDLLDSCYKQLQSTAGEKKRLPGALDSYNFNKGHYVSVEKARHDEGWKLDKEWVPSDNLPTRNGFVRRPVLTTTTPGSVLHFSFKGNAVGIAIVSGPDAGIITYSIDGGPWMKRNLYTEWSSSLYLPWYVLLSSGLKYSRHELAIKIETDKDYRSKGNACDIVYFFVNGKNK
jgi:sialidase-1